MEVSICSYLGIDPRVPLSPHDCQLYHFIRSKPIVPVCFSAVTPWPQGVWLAVTYCSLVQFPCPFSLLLFPFHAVTRWLLTTAADKHPPVKLPLRHSPCSLLGRGTISANLTPCNGTSGGAVISGEVAILFVTLSVTTFPSRLLRRALA
jgi:hypothetical protein